MTELKVDATLENLTRVLDFVEEKLEMCNCSMKTIMQIQIAVKKFMSILHPMPIKKKKVKQS